MIKPSKKADIPDNFYCLRQHCHVTKANKFNINFQVVIVSYVCQSSVTANKQLSLTCQTKYHAEFAHKLSVTHNIAFMTNQVKTDVSTKKLLSTISTYSLLQYLTLTKFSTWVPIWLELPGSLTNNDKIPIHKKSILFYSIPKIVAT